MKWNMKLVLFMMLVAVIITGCVPLKKVVLFQGDTQTADTASYRYLESAEFQVHKVKRGDYLYINVRTSIDEYEKRYEDLFNISSGQNTNQMGNNSNLYLTSYLVDNEGNIDIPTIGKVYVEGMTVDAIKDVLTKRVQEYTPNAVVNVKLVNFKVTVMGEIARPGVIQVYDDKISVYEVLAQSGDIKTWGKRNSVLLIRQTEKGREIHKLDILKDDFLSSEFYYLKPNDIVYIEPMKGKQWGFEAFPYTFVFSTVAFMLSLWAVFK